MLREFFYLADDGWHNKRCDDEIACASLKAERNRTVGKLGGRPPKKATQEEPTNNPDGFQNATQTEPTNNPSQTPDSRLQTPEEIQIPPLPPRKRGERSASIHEFPPGFAEFWSAYPRKTAKTQAAKAFARLAPDGALLAVLLRAVAAQRTWEQWTRDGGQFVPHASTWLNGRRWEDSPMCRPLSADVWEGAA